MLSIPETKTEISNVEYFSGQVSVWQPDGSEHDPVYSGAEKEGQDEAGHLHHDWRTAALWPSPLALVYDSWTTGQTQGNHFPIQPDTACDHPGIEATP